MYGDQIETEYGRKSIIGWVTSSHVGNIVLRVGRRYHGWWTSTEHVVLTPDEARALISEVEAHLHDRL